VRSTAAIGVFKIVAETSSAANVRRIEALTGPAAVELLRRHDVELGRAAAALRVAPGHVAETAVQLRARVRELERAPRPARDGAGAPPDLEQLLAAAEMVDGARVLTAAVPDADTNALLELADRIKGRLADAAIVLGSAADERVALVANVAPALVARGVKADEVVKLAAAVVGGGGGGRDTLARAGGRHPDKLGEAIAAARAAIEAALSQ
jgi:alanyl-tRNA synthetase